MFSNRKILLKKWADERFPLGGVGDEKDAYRHIVWAALLARKLGEEKAKLFLEAHEKNPYQNRKFRNMDEANNVLGIKLSKSVAAIKEERFLKILDKKATQAIDKGAAYILYKKDSKK